MIELGVRVDFCLRHNFMEEHEPYNFFCHGVPPFPKILFSFAPFSLLFMKDFVMVMI